jgi:hypothetical protein
MHGEKGYDDDARIEHKKGSPCPSPHLPSKYRATPDIHLKHLQLDTWLTWSLELSSITESLFYSG